MAAMELQETPSVTSRNSAARPLVDSNVEEGLKELVDDGGGPSLAQENADDSLDSEFNKHLQRAKKLQALSTRSSVPLVTPPRRYSHAMDRRSTRAPTEVAKTFEYWFPTANKFKFSYTISYWVAVLSLQGSIIMLYCAIIGYFDTQKLYPAKCKTYITLALCILFLISTWLAWIQTINLATTSRRYLIPESWDSLPASRESVVGAAAYFIAMFIWTIGAVFDCLPHEVKATPVGEFFERFFQYTSVCPGAVGFFIGGVCECLHSRHVKSLMEPVVWISVLDVLAGFHLILYTLCILLKSYMMFARFNYIWAGVNYTIASALMLVMWQGDDFGLALLGQINDAIDATKVVRKTSQSDAQGKVNINLPEFIAFVDQQRRSSVDKEKKQLSLRGAAFLCVYCYLFGVVFVNAMHSLFAPAHEYLDWPRDLVMLCITAVVLLIHSGLTHAPNVQPFRSAIFALRFIFMVAAIVHSVILYWSLRDVVETAP